MDTAEIDGIFYHDGYRLAGEYLQQGMDALRMSSAIDQLYRSVDGLMASFLQRSDAEGRPAACRKACDWCCHQAVFAVTHELLYLREYVKKVLTGEEEKHCYEMARKKADVTFQKPVKDLLFIRETCPFLHEHMCRVYVARPMACRIYLSSSEVSCRREYDDPGNETLIPELFEFPLRAGRMLNEGFVAFLKEKGMHVAELPLEQGYVSMVTMDQDMHSWVRS